MRPYRGKRRMKVTLSQLTCLYQFWRVMGVSVMWTFLLSAGRGAASLEEEEVASIWADGIVIVVVEDGSLSFLCTSGPVKGVEATERRAVARPVRGGWYYCQGVEG